MSKSSSGLFSGTKGAVAAEALSAEAAARQILGIKADEPTATVWPHIHATQPEYPGTVIPRSFKVDTPNGTFWVHGHGTKHMDEIASRIHANSNALSVVNPNLFSQFILYDFRKSLIAASSEGIKFKKSYKVGHWELRFSRDRDSDSCPVVYHARFLGFK